MVSQLQYNWPFNYFIQRLFMALCWTSVRARPLWVYLEGNCEHSTNAFHLLNLHPTWKWSISWFEEQENYPIVLTVNWHRSHIPFSNHIHFYLLWRRGYKTVRVQRLMLLGLKTALHRFSFSNSHEDLVPVLPWVSNTDRSTSGQVRGRQRTPFF